MDIWNGGDVWGMCFLLLPTHQLKTPPAMEGTGGELYTLRKLHQMNEMIMRSLVSIFNTTTKDKKC